MQTSLDCPQGPVHTLALSRLQEGIRVSHDNGRGRVMVPIQRSESAPVQRLVNVMQPGSYVQPHAHPRPQAIELVSVLRGALAFLVFDGSGALLQRVVLTPGGDPAVLDIEPGVWHTVAALVPDTVVLEIKGGPHDPLADKVFAAWAPKEGDPECEAYLQSLLEEVPPA